MPLTAYTTRSQNKLKEPLAEATAGGRMTLRSDRLPSGLQTQIHNPYGANIEGGMAQLMKFKGFRASMQHMGVSDRVKSCPGTQTYYVRI